jgi:hypothetical protein
MYIMSDTQITKQYRKTKMCNTKHEKCKNTNSDGSDVKLLNSLFIQIQEKQLKQFAESDRRLSQLKLTN